MTERSTMVALKSLIGLCELIGEGINFKGHFTCLAFVIMSIL